MKLLINYLKIIEFHTYASFLALPVGSYCQAGFWVKKKKSCEVQHTHDQSHARANGLAHLCRFLLRPIYSWLWSWLWLAVDDTATWFKAASLFLLWVCQLRKKGPREKLIWPAGNFARRGTQSPMLEPFSLFPRLEWEEWLRQFMTLW